MNVQEKMYEMPQPYNDINSVQLKTEVSQSFSNGSVEPARQITSKSYSLAPDMMGGWKPRKIDKKMNKPPFTLQYDDILTDGVAQQASKQDIWNEKIVYLGPRKANSFLLHEEKGYSNPYQPGNKAISTPLNKNKVRQNIKLKQSDLKFDSDFESGNLDLAIEKTSCEFDLYMRVDTNTRGHTNWFYFSIQNSSFTSTVKFNIRNFRRQQSLYQKGLKPFVRSTKKRSDWKQSGRNLSYRRCPYKPQQLSNQLSKYFMLSFQYQFEHQHDTVQFAYGVPYLYSQLLAFLDTLRHTERLPSLKSLSGLNIPVLRITNQDAPEESKKVVMITARTHPGQSNSSYVMEGVLRCLANDSTLSRSLKNKYIFIIIPMVNPDGVVAGNYRTSLFGKDLNRTYDQSRKYAFPETYEILQLARKLKDKYKQQFSIYIDLHGHSAKKNVFMYGPDYSLQSVQYDQCRKLPKLMSQLFSFFRYYSCSFRIAGVKASTSRAIFSRNLNIPFSYTMETSNGLFLGPNNDNIQVNTAHWREVGTYLCQSLEKLDLDKFKRIRRIKTEKIQKNRSLQFEEVIPASHQGLDENNSDCDDPEEDLPDDVLEQLQNVISQGRCKDLSLKKIKAEFCRDDSKSFIQVDPLKKLTTSVNKISRKAIKRQLQQQREQNSIKQIFLPVILRQRGQIPLMRSRKREIQPSFLKTPSKRYAVLPVESVSFVQRDSRSVVLVHQVHEKKEEQKSKITENRNGKREKVLHTLIERLKTLK